MRVTQGLKGVSGTVLVAALMSACGGGGSSGGTPAGYSVGGAVSGLAAGATVVLQQNGGDDLSVTSNGPFTFQTPMENGANYVVTVKTQPSGQTCSVTNGSGSATSNVDDIAVSCGTGSGQTPTPTPTPTLGVDGLVGSWLQSLCVQANGSGNRKFLRVTKTGETSFSLETGVMQYAATDCSGSGSLYGQPTQGGSVSLFRTAATSTLAANWGLWTYTGGQAYSIWAKKGETILCLIGDSNPSSFPTAAAVEGYADLSIQGGACYTAQ